MTTLASHAPVCLLDDLFADQTAWEAARAALLKELAIPSEDHAPEDGPALLAWLQQLDRLQRAHGRLSTYIGVQSFVDSRNAALQTASGLLRAPAAKLAGRIASLNTLLSQTEPENWTLWCAEAPGLSAYDARYRSLLAGRQHALPPATEQALAALDGSLQLPIQVYRRIKAGDLRFPQFVDSTGQQQPFSLSHYEKRFETSADAGLRANAARTFIDGVTPHRHAFSSAYAGEITRQVSLARLRGFDDTMDFLFWQQGIDRRFFEAQRSVFNKRLPLLMRQFADIKRRLLGLDRLAWHDLKAYPPQIPAQISFEQTRTAIIAAGQRMGHEYAEVLQRAFDEGWIEYGQQPHKADSSGCASPFGPHPYVLMTWTGSPRDMFLLAHELGHAIHFHWSAQHQAVLNATPLRYFIEAPSTFNELLLADHLLQHADARQRFSTVFELLNSYYHNFVTHYLESEFQVRVYQQADAGKVPGTDALQAIKTDVLRTFWGNSIDIDDNAGLIWLRQQHYYMGLYPYTYAAGQSIATLHHARLQQDPSASTRWCDALRKGSSVNAENLLKELDLELDNPAAFHSVLDSIEAHIVLLEELAQPYLPNGEPIHV